MTQISASLVKMLRDKTGAGMMDCKKALVEAKGDVENAISILRKKGQKVAAKRTERETLEGTVLSKASADNTFGALVCLGCETDFVAKNDDFIKLAESILQVALEKKIKHKEDLLKEHIDGVSIEEKIVAQIGLIGEKISLADYHFTEGSFIKSYIHPGNRLASIVNLSEKGDGIDETAKFIAMQVASMKPTVIAPDSIPQNVIDKEIDIAKEQLKETLQGKSEQMVENILKGRIAKFSKEISLNEQPFIMNDKQSVKQYLKEKSSTLIVKDFHWYQTGA